MPKEIRFTPQLFEFLEELKANNNKEWFEANRHRYLEFVRDPMLAFIAAIRPRLANISPYLVVDPKPNGGSMLRVYRDVRFSKSKLPYKTNAAAYFPHQASKENTPGIYLHLEPNESFLAAGIYQPDTATRRKITDAIANQSDGWKQIVTERQFKAKLAFIGESLARVPKQYDEAHSFAEDLKRKDFAVSAKLSPQQICAKDFLDCVETICHTANPLLAFLTKAIGLKW